MEKEEKIPDTDMKIPVRVLQDRTLSGLEAIVEYGIEESKLGFHDLAILLNRDERNIWTVYDRSKKKRKQKRLDEFIKE